MMGFIIFLGVALQKGSILAPHGAWPRPGGVASLSSMIGCFALLLNLPYLLIVRHQENNLLKVLKRSDGETG